MRKSKIFNKFKKILISIMCVITLLSAMPIKSEADTNSIVGSLVSIIMSIPTGILELCNNFSGMPVKTSHLDVNLKGWDTETRGNLYNFEVTPYTIFTSGTKKQYIDKNGNPQGDKYTVMPLLDINFFRNDGSDEHNSADILRPVVGNVYKSLRNFCLVLMIIVLMYIGIRIMISSAISDQVKYKQMLIDWVVGICLLFTMQYIMSGLMNLNTVVLNILGAKDDTTYYISLSSLDGGGWGDIINKYNSDDTDIVYFVDKHIDVADSSNESDDATKNKSGRYIFQDDGTITVDSRKDWGTNGKVFINARIYRSSNEKYKTMYKAAVLMGTSLIPVIGQIESTVQFFSDSTIFKLEDDIPDNDSWADKAVYRCNLLEYIRTITTMGSKYVYVYGNGMYTAYNGSDNTTDSWSTSTTLGYAILYIALTIETVMFLVTYIKRVIHLAFLTMISPLIALMYPIDRIGDQKSQTFNKWFKDYLFYILLQPMHLLLYMVFIYAAVGLMEQSIIYALVAYGFMIPAEKFFKTMFGFDNAPHAGGMGMGGPLAAGMAMKGFDALRGVGPGSHGGKSGGSGKGGADMPKRKWAKKKFGTDSSDGGAANSSGLNPMSSGIGNALGNKSTNGKGKNNKLPNAGGTGKHQHGNALLSTAGRRISRAATGKWDTLKGHKLDAVKHLGGKFGKFAGRTIAKGAGAAALGSLGLMAGAVTAMTTGDPTNVLKGVGAGLATGWSRGGQFANSIGNGASDFIEEANIKRGDLDENYRDQKVAEEQLEKYQSDINRLPEEDRENVNECIQAFAPYMGEFNSFDQIKAMSAAYADSDKSISAQQEIYNRAKESASWGDLKDDSRAQSYMNFQTKEELGKIKDSDINIDKNEIREKANKDIKSKKSALEAEKQKSIEEYEKKIANVHSVGNKKAEKKYNDEMNAKSKEYDSKIHDVENENNYDEVREQLLSQKKNELAQKRAEEALEKAKKFQETLKK